MESDMKRIAAICLLAFLGMAFQVNRSRTFAWEYPGDISQVKEFRLYYGTTAGGPYPGKLVIPAGSLQGTATLAKGTYYFVCTAANEDSESAYSNEASTTVYDNAMKPINLRIVVNP
jgi:hypothetical protein